MKANSEVTGQARAADCKCRQMLTLCCELVLSQVTRERIYLRDGYSTLFGKFLFGFFTGVGVGQVGVEILIQDLCGLFAEVAPFASVEAENQ